MKNPPAVQETWAQSLGWEDPLEKGVATHSSILAWRIPWAEDPGSPGGCKKLDTAQWFSLTQLSRVKRPEGGALIPACTRRRKGPLLSWQGPEQWKVMDSVYWSPPSFLLPSMKACAFPCPVGTCTWLNMFVDPELQFFCWSQICPSLLEKYQEISLFQVNIWK